MPTFNYIGRTIEGKEVKGVANASSREGVAEQLMREQIIPIKIYKGGDSVLKRLMSYEITPKKVRIEEMVAFCKQMQTMLKVGITVVDSLVHIGNSTQSATLKRVLPAVAESISSGLSLTDALKQHKKIFSTVFVNIVAAGEGSGKLDYSFERLAAYLKLEDKTIKQIKSAVRYPAIVLVVTIVAFAVVNLLVIPSFAGLFSKVGAELPTPTRILVSTSNFFVDNWILMLGIILLMIFSFSFYIKTKKGRYVWHYLLLKMPVAGKIMKNAMLARFCRIFAMILQTGIPLVTGFGLVSDTLGNDYFAKKVDSMREGVEKGENITKVATELDVFPPMVIQMLAIGEETGVLDTLLIEVAQYYEAEVEYDLSRLSDLIEPIMLVIMGGMIAMIAIGVFLPMWSIAGAIGQ